MFGGGRGPLGLLADLFHPPLVFSGGTALVFRAIHLTIFWGTDRGHVGQRTDARTGTGGAYRSVNSNGSGLKDRGSFLTSLTQTREDNGSDHECGTLAQRLYGQE